MPRFKQWTERPQVGHCPQHSERVRTLIGTANRIRNALLVVSVDDHMLLGGVLGIQVCISLSDGIVDMNAGVGFLNDALL